MIGALADAAIRSAALAGVIALLLWTVRVRSAALRLHVWRAGLFAACLMPVWTAAAPSFARIEVERPFEVPQAWPAPRAAASVSAPPPAATDRAALIPALAVPPQRVRVTYVLAAIYWLGVAILTLRLIAGWMSSRRLRRRLRPVETDAVSMSGGLPLFESPDVSVPLTIGAVAPRIVLPSGWTAWPDGKIAMALAHERAHVRRRDALTLRLAMLYRALFWFSLVSWWWEKRLRALAEQAADESALAETRMPPHAYAAFLLEFYRAVAGSGRRVGWHLAMAAGRVHDARVQRILEWSPERARHSRAASVTLLGLVVLTTAASASIVTSSPLRGTRLPVVLHAIQAPFGSSVTIPPSAPLTPPGRPRRDAPQQPAPAAASTTRPAPVNLAGVWIPVDPSRASALFDVGLGDTPDTGMTITQDDDEQTLTITRLPTGGRIGRSLIAPEFFRRTVHRLDGVAVLDGSSSETSTTRWEGQSLVADATGPRGSRRTVLSLEGDLLRLQVDATPLQGSSISAVTLYKRRSHGGLIPFTPLPYLPVRTRPGGMTKTICGLTVIEQSPDLDGKILMPPDPRGGAAVRRIEPDVCTDDSGR